MKFVRTARGYQALALEGVTITATPQELANEKADAAVKAGEQHGVSVLAFDSEAEALDGAPATSVALGREADLSVGVGAVTGTGDPVQTPGVTPAGDTPDQATGQNQES